MDLNEIKKIIKEEKAKIIITDEMGPTLIVLNYDEYKAMRDNKPMTEEIKKEEIPEELKNEQLKIEDLPF